MERFSESNPQIFMLVDKARPASEVLFDELEKPNWAPWLSFEPRQLSKQAEVFPEGQIALSGGEGKADIMLSSNRVDWDGKIDSLPTWDDVAGEDLTFEETFKPAGNTLVLMSMSSKKGVKGQAFSTAVFDRVKDYAAHQGLEHILGDFRPSDFGRYKAETGKMDFADYCTQPRDDGQLKDSWLRAVSRQGTQFLKYDRRAMVIPADFEQVSQWSLEYKPDKWWEVTDPDQIDYLIKWHEPLKDLEQVDQIWECEETGTWYIDTKNGKAVYIESNLWGEIPGKTETIEKPLPKYRYDLGEEEIKNQEENLVEAVKIWYPQPGVYGAWITPDHVYANAVRSLEVKHFPEIPKLVDDEVEKKSLFYVLVDTRDGENRIVHGARLSGLQLKFNANDVFVDGGSHFIVVDELVNKGRLSEVDFKAYCEERGIDVAKSFSVETNFRVGGKVPPMQGVGTADMVYLNLNRILEEGGSAGSGRVFASINRASRISFSHSNIEFDEIPTLPDSTGVKYDLVALPVAPSMKKLAESLGGTMFIQNLKFV